MPLDLDPIKDFLEEEMAATTVLVTTDTQGIADDTFSTATLQYTPAPGDVTTIYTGKAMISADNNQPAAYDDGGNIFDRTFYRMRLPVNSPELPIKARVVCLTNDRSGHLVGAIFRVVDIVANTFAVSDVYQMIRYRPRPLGEVTTPSGP